jgi:diguanylate cyclase (GGDEF)-like protein
MLNATHKTPRRRGTIQPKRPILVRRFRRTAPPDPKIIDEKFATAMKSGEPKQIDRMLREIARISPPSESPERFFGLMSGLLARTAQQAARLRLDERQFRNQALTDELTGLHNRRGFFALAAQQLKIARRNGQRALLFFADVNSLKQINDRLGHSEGDSAIQRTARALRRTFRDSDILGRLGGDEFAVLANEAGPHCQEDILRRLKENLHSEGLREPRYPLSISVGVARFDPQNPASLDDLLNRADRAMYEAKRSRRAGECLTIVAEAPAGNRMSAPAA